MRGSSKRTKHVNARYFYIKDVLENQDQGFSLQFCPTDNMVAYFFTKPLQGWKFHKLRKMIMGEAEMKQMKEKE